MTLSDAHVSQAVVHRFQARLASAEVLPIRSLRRNSGEYPLVCYINDVTALFVSENSEAVPIFVARAAEHMIAGLGQAGRGHPTPNPDVRRLCPCCRFRSL